MIQRIHRWTDRGHHLGIAGYARFVALKARVQRRVPAISQHIAELIWAVIVVVLGLVAYAFFGTNGAGQQWLSNTLKSITQFNT